MINARNLKLTGFRRPDGRFGVRNHVIILPGMNALGALARTTFLDLVFTPALGSPRG